MRMALIEEEFCELLEAYYSPAVAAAVATAIAQATNKYTQRALDVVEVTDALADLEYVIHGMALEAGIPLDDAIAEVHRANMSKLGEDGKPVVLDDPPGKVGKGPNYIPPQLGDLIAQHNHRTQP